MTDRVRKAALTILDRLDQKNAILDRQLELIQENHPSFSRRDRSLLHALVYGVMRWRGRIDWVIGRFSNIPVEKVDSRVLNILRLGAFQILLLNKIPVSAAVNTSVELAKAVSRSRAAGYVNGVLRHMVRKHKDLSLPEVEHDPVSALAVIHSFPEWLIRRWIDRFGVQKTQDLCQSINRIPPTTIRTNTLKTTRTELVSSLSGLAENIRISTYSPEGVYFDLPKMPIAEMPPFKKGWFQVQDDAAQLISNLLGPKPEESVIDACAGFGGKTGHIAQLMHNTGRIYAVDDKKYKLSRLLSEMKRLGVSIVSPYFHDLYAPLNAAEINRCDRILLDAPCSGLGVLRRNPDAKWHHQPNALKQYQERQIVFLNHLAPLVNPSGILNYTVCSIEPEETTEVVSHFLGNHPNFSIHRTNSGVHPDIQQMMHEYGYLRTYPDFHDMDGFFSVNLKRMA